MTKPILYSFRRCPYAMRARLALKLAGVEWEHREVDLKNKPAHMLEISPKGTVPVLLLEDGTAIEESLDIMLWALDPTDLAGIHSEDRESMLALIHENDTGFKTSLDRFKYPARYDPVEDAESHRQNGVAFIEKLDQMLTDRGYLFGDTLSFADLAIFPFVRQFSRVDPDWFEGLPYVRCRAWLKGLVGSELFASVMGKYIVCSST